MLKSSTNHNPNIDTNPKAKYRLCSHTTGHEWVREDASEPVRHLRPTQHALDNDVGECGDQRAVCIYHLRRLGIMYE